MKEYRVMQMIAEGPHKGKWTTAWHPTGGKHVNPFSSLQDAQDWIERQPEWYAEYNRRWPPQCRKEVPQYRIEAREVTSWEPI